MKFKHKTDGTIVTIKTGTADLVWYTKENDKTLYLLEADKFFIEYESIKQKENKCKI